MPKMLMIGPARNRPTSASGTESSTLHSSDWRASRLARSSSPAPTACATRIELPTASADSADSTKNMICNALPIPAIAAVPSPATSSVSTIPSKVSSTFWPITGQAIRSTRRRSTAGSGAGVATAVPAVDCSVSLSIVYPSLKIPNGRQTLYQARSALPSASLCEISSEIAYSSSWRRSCRGSPNISATPRARSRWCCWRSWGRGYRTTKDQRYALCTGELVFALIVSHCIWTSSIAIRAAIHRIYDMPRACSILALQAAPRHAAPVGACPDRRQRLSSGGGGTYAVC